MRSLCLLAVLALLACSWDAKKSSSDNSRERGPTPLQAQRDPGAVAEDEDDEWEEDELEPETPEQEPEPEAEDEEDKRDYSAELRGAFGSPLGCLKQRGDDAPDQITIELEAVVMSGGNISRSSATSSELREDELACVEQRLRGVRLPRDVQDAPRTVDATITLELQKPGH